MKMQFTYNIFLIGFMGSGKSTVADYLCEKFGMDVVEMDQVCLLYTSRSLQACLWPADSIS